MQTLGRRLATGDRFLKEISREMPGELRPEQDD